MLILRHQLLLPLPGDKTRSHLDLGSELPWLLLYAASTSTSKIHCKDLERDELKPSLPFPTLPYFPFCLFSQRSEFLHFVLFIICMGLVLCLLFSVVFISCASFPSWLFSIRNRTRIHFQSPYLALMWTESFLVPKVKVELLCYQKSLLSPKGDFRANEGPAETKGYKYFEEKLLLISYYNFTLVSVPISQLS